MSALSTTPPYGMSAIRQIKATNTHSKPGKLTSRLAKRKESTYVYFLEKVDPILGDCITHLLIEQPNDVPFAMINYFKLLQAKQTAGSSAVDDLLQPAQWPAIKPRKEMKLFLAANIAPIVSKLVNRIALSLPEDLLGYIVNELESMMSESSLLPDYTQDNNGNDQTSLPNPDQPVKASEPVSDDSTNVRSNIHVAESTVSRPPSSHPPSALPVDKPKDIHIGVFGIGNAGKTTLLNILQGKFDPHPKATAGFRPVSMQLSEDCKVQFYDLGGGPKIRGIWDQYYFDVHGIIYVLDASLADEDLTDTLTVLEATLSNPQLLGKPLVIFANQQDRPNARAAAFWQDILGIPEDYEANLFIAECSGHIPSDEEGKVPEGYTPDPNIESAVDLLLQSVTAQYAMLQARVEKDTKLKAQQDAKKRLERERNVLKKKIAEAHYSLLSPTLLESLGLSGPVDDSNIFSAQEGEEFLAAEIGVEGNGEGLGELGRRIAQGVGYQRLALQMVGSLKVPISKKKVAMSWEEIDELVQGLRVELGLA
eukprot:gene25118-30335_t